MFWRRDFWGIVFLLLGILLLLAKLDFIDYSFRKMLHDFWPILIVLVGILLIVNSLRRRERFHDFEFGRSAEQYGNFGRKHSHVFGDTRLETNNMEVDGLENSTVFGDTFLSLAGAKLKSGISRVSISTTFGDITVMIPAGMEVAATAAATFGDLHILDKMADGISSRLSAQTPGYEAAASKLQISASATFGDIRIYRG